MEHLKFAKILQNKILNRISSIEFIVSEKCQNACSYCYRTKVHNSSSLTYIEPKRIEIFLENFQKLFGVDKQFFQNRKAELFGGDALLDYQKLKEILQILSEKGGFQKIVVPTNSRMLQELAPADIEELVKSSNKKLILSLSVDGSPQDSQRNLSKFGKMLSYQEQTNYDFLVNISKKYNFGFHPMLTFESISTWIETIKFFHSYNVLPYLLEVRHPLTKGQAIEAVRQMVLIRRYVEKNYPEKILRQSNTLCFSIVPRGLSCSALTSISINPNGNIPFCHRVTDDPWVGANLFDMTFNLSKMVTMKSIFDHRNHPICMVCPIRKLCSGQCCGSSYEYWGDPWIPISSICLYTKLKYFIMSKHFLDWQEVFRYCKKSVLYEDLLNYFEKDELTELYTL